MPALVDLHMHTDHSDGTFSAAEVVAAARRAKLVAFAITDHDTIAGYREALTYVGADDPELISGVEFSVAMDDSEMHLLAYLFDPDNERLADRLEGFREERNLRGGLMVERLNRLGLDLSMEAVRRHAGKAAIGRPHIAEALVDAGMVDSFEQAFRKYIGNHCPAYVPKNEIGPAEAIELVHWAGGVAIMAHPFVNDMHRHLPGLVDLELDGVEVEHYSHSKQQRREVIRLAKRHGLLMSGGSDFHGRQRHEGEIGCFPVPVSYLDALKERAVEIRGKL
jgi:hypothetical protein